MSGATAVQRQQRLHVEVPSNSGPDHLVLRARQDGENQIVENRLRGKENSSSAQNERRIFTEHQLEFHAGDIIGSEHRQECLNREARK